MRVEVGSEGFEGRSERSFPDQHPRPPPPWFPGKEVAKSKKVVGMNFYEVNMFQILNTCCSLQLILSLYDSL